MGVYIGACGSVIIGVAVLVFELIMVGCIVFLYFLYFFNTRLSRVLSPHIIHDIAAATMLALSRTIGRSWQLLLRLLLGLSQFGIF